MIVAAIDIGTNSVRLLIAQFNGHWRDLVRTVEVTRLGEDVNRTHRMKPEAMERTLAVLARYKEQMAHYGVDRVRVVSTSAMRDAENAHDFIALVRERLNLEIEVISGKVEGQLTFIGVTGQDSLTPHDVLSLVVDVGGGSTEFIYGAEGHVFGATSLDIGSVRLTEFFIRHDPPLEGELENIRETIRDVTAPVFAYIKAAKPSIIVAVAGTATQLSAIRYGVEPYDPRKIHGSRITLSDLSALIGRLARLGLEERKNLKGMHPQRADVIVAGALILEETLRALGFSEMVVSEHDILDGIAYSLV